MRTRSRRCGSRRTPGRTLSMTVMAQALFLWLFLSGMTPQVQATQTLEQQIATLGRQLRVEEGDDGATSLRVVADGGVDRMRGLLIQLTQRTLDDNPKASAAQLRTRLAAVYSPWTPMPFEQDGGQYTASTPEVFRQTLNGKDAVVVSWLMWVGGGGSPESKFLVLGFAQGPRGFQLMDQTGAIFDHHSEFMNEVASKQPAEVWLFVHGHRFGSTHRPLTAALLAFDGSTFRTRWSRLDLWNGKIEEVPGGFQLKYEDHSLNDILETWEFVASGVVRRLRGSH
jgi:hypothetical protein